MPDALFRHAGALAEDYAGVDWSTTPLGSPASWSSTLRNTVALMLRTRFPVTLIWGPEHVLVYNEAYVELIGEKHPAALGARCADVFDEAWPVIGPLIDDVLCHSEAFFLEDAAVPLKRHGYLEECYFTYAYSPVTDASGVVEGIMDIATETTRSVITQRRLALLARLPASQHQGSGGFRESDDEEEILLASLLIAA